MKDYYLSTNDEAAMHDALALVEVAYSLDVIGEWYDYDPESDISVARPGWYFNVRAEAEIEWPATVTQIAPVTPWRIWG